MDNLTIDGVLGIYCRVSTAEQEQKNTIQGQINAANDFIKHHNIQHYKFFTDDGVSGTYEELSKRPGLLELNHYIKEGSIKAIWVFKMDRLARNYTLYANFLYELKKKNIRIFENTKEYNLDKPEDTFLANIMGVIASYETETIKLRMMTGMKRLKDDGGYAKSTLYGFTSNSRDNNTKKRIIVPNKEELDIMKTIFTNLLEGKSLHYIAKYIIKIGNSGSWVDRVRYPEYAGYTKNTKGELIKSKIYTYPIITLEEHKKIVELMDSRGKAIKKKMFKANHLGSGIITCGYCGVPYYLNYTLNRYKKKYNYYIHLGLRFKKTDCDTRYLNFPEELTDKVFYCAYGLYYILKDNIAKEIQNVQNRLNSEMMLNSSKLTIYNKRLVDIDKELSNIASVLRKHPDTFNYDADILKLTSEKKKLNEAIINFNSSYDLEYKEQEYTKSLLLNMNVLTYKDLPVEKKREYIISLFKSVKVFDSHILVFSTYTNSHFIFYCNNKEAATINTLVRHINNHIDKSQTNNPDLDYLYETVDNPEHYIKMLDISDKYPLKVYDLRINLSKIFYQVYLQVFKYVVEDKNHPKRENFSNKELKEMEADVRKFELLQKKNEADIDNIIAKL